jgi:hypothetical protein
MKHIFTLTITILLFCFSSAAASPRIGHYPAGMCTRDFNLWGHASQCSCNEQELYDARAGLCFKDGDGEKIMVQGAMLTGMVAIGGETTGFVIKTPEEVSYELVLKVTDQEKLQKISGMWFEVTGDFINIMSVEMGARKAIIVDTLGVLE